MAGLWCSVLRVCRWCDERRKGCGGAVQEGMCLVNPVESSGSMSLKRVSI